MFIEITPYTGNPKPKVLINIRHIRIIHISVEKEMSTLIILTDQTHIYCKETYEQVKAMITNICEVESLER